MIVSVVPLMGHLNKSIAALDRPGPRCVDLICNRARFISALVSKHFFNVHFTNLMHA